MTLAEKGERGLIAYLRDRFPCIGPLDDDGAVLPTLSCPVVTTDSFNEGVHFHRWWCDAGVLGRRLLEATLSDLAAMGASPGFVTVAASLPGDLEIGWIGDFYAGLASRDDCRIVGGETVSGPVAGFTLTAVGDAVDPGRVLRRSGLRPGDGLWLTGRLGRAFDIAARMAAAGGLHGSGLVPASPVPDQWIEQLRAFLSPRAAFAEAAFLADHGVSCAIDISDGLVSEAGHLARESGVDVDLELDSVPLFPSAGSDALGAACSGEDFVILFGVRDASESMETAGFSLVGLAKEGSGRVRVLESGREVETGLSGYDHFRNRTGGSAWRG
jgi:thiamine-monophosphate kinase